VTITVTGLMSTQFSMTTSDVPPLSSVNQTALRSLIRSIERSQGTFSLILARCNFQQLRDRVQANLKAQLQIPFHEVVLQPHAQSLYTAIRQALGPVSPTALIIHGLERVEDLDTLLRVANQSREEFRNHLSCPLVIWVTDDILNRLIRDATDFESWASVTLEFEAELSELTEFVMSTADELFAQLLGSREHIFLDNDALDLDENSPLRAELRAACDVIHQRLDPLPPEVEASGQFILGRVADNNTEVARHHYERSLELWEQVGHLEHYGHVQFYLGFWWGNYAVRHLPDRATGLDQAKAYLEGAIQTFEQIGQPHRVAQFINFLGEVLHRQEDWSALDDLAHKAFTLNQQFCDYFRQARALGFMAAVAIAHQNWAQAEYLASQALAIWQTATSLAQAQGDRAAFLDWERRFHRPWYLFFLGNAQRHSHQLAKAAQTLEEARKTAKPSYDPDLYISILNELRDIYFAQKLYLKAYKTRQERREIQGKFNLRPFVGPGRLQASQDITNPSLPQHHPRDRVAPEIETSEREQDVEAILQRIERKDFRLSVIYGPSGVGKSSTLQAGIIPALKQITFEGRHVITVLQQVYHNWVQELGHQLLHACQEMDTELAIAPTLDTLDLILEQLRTNSQQQFKTVLMFDQFEEFFFANSNVEERYRFYNFAVDCFRILDIEVILSMKEDYLHFLLACNRLSGLEIIGNNILDKKILYYIGNFSKEEAYSIVKNRTQNTRITFDDALIGQLVNDLADSFDQVRPIELQIVGAQLQTDGITTLTDYCALGQGESKPRQILVNRYLESVVEDCGPENQELAEIILYLLTNEDGTRPIKTKTELMRAKLCEALYEHPDQIDLILEIFVQAGLVLLVPSAPVDAYQLVHDYLVNLIREKVQTKYQQKIAQLTRKVEGLDKIVRFLAVLLLSLVSVGLVLYLLYRNNKLLYQVTELERNAIENRSKFDGYQLISLEHAIREADKFDHRTALAKRTTLPIYTLQYVLDNISERRWLDTRQVQIFAADVHVESGRVATAGLDKTVKVWDFDGNLKHRLDVSAAMDASAQIWDVRFTAEGDRIAVIDSAGQLMMWSLQGDSSQLVTAVQAHQSDRYLTRLIASPDQSVFVTSGDDGWIRVWQAADLTLQAEWPAHDISVSSLAFSPDGQTLVSADYDSNVRIWQMRPNAPATLRRELSVADQGELLITFGLAISPDGQLLAAASEDGFVHIWDLASGERLQRFLGHNGQWITAIDFIRRPDAIGADGDAFQMVTSDSEGVMRSWNVDRKTSIQVREVKGHQGWIWNLLHTPHDTVAQPQLISTGIDGSLRFWDLGNTFDQTSSFITRFMGHEHPQLKTGQAWSTSYSPRQGRLATSGSDAAKVWQLNPNLASAQPPQALFTLKHENSPVTDCETLMAAADRRTQDVFWVVFSPDETIIATAGADCTARLWDSETGQPLQRTNATGEQQPIVLPHLPDAYVYTVAFSPQGDRIATADSQGRLFLWTVEGEQIGDNVHTAQLSGTHKKQPVFAVKFSPDGKSIATASEDGDVKVWTLTPEGRLPSQPAAILPGHRNGATSVDFSGDGLLATAGKDGTVRIWDLHDHTEQPPELIQALSAYNQRVTWVEFQHREGGAAPELLATASKDGSVIIWDRSLEGWGLQKPGKRFKLRYQFSGHQNGAFSSTFLTGRSQLAVAQGDGQIKLWRLENTQELIQRACLWMGVAETAESQRPPVTRNLPWAQRNIPEIDEICRRYW
jgi:WD40 repeat protein